MQKVLIFIIEIILKTIAALPLRVWFFISSYLIFPLLFYVLKYRKKVVISNLQNSFPEKTSLEIEEIARKFYVYLADNIVETIKRFNISEKELNKRITIKNPELIEKYFNEGKNLMLSVGHVGNYEWFGSFIPKLVSYEVLVPYRKLTSPVGEAIMKKNRGIFGIIAFPTLETAQYLKKKYSKPFMLFMANDQSAHPYKAFWTEFLHQATSFYPGTEKLAKLFDMPVVFAHVKVPKRGYYEVTFELLSDEPKVLPEGEIMKMHAATLEKDIIARPEFWLWSHRRWKHKMPEELEFGFVAKKDRKVRL
ncbi:MAG: lysophospholipid acyltransferase family protein [Cytophagaceae bacterium]|nr:lysophospholipid acyltransferase family protein [Cytophagaceae bacterium]MBK9933067.1 lysophospholipid acyltransferase family protein [Cytophagaceae bacterium]MBL0303215.1 lysophospholipid acyltransferase family protein [Cytophagaceae bacterium]MBL0326065.1 lysophospholipid acyltransferase family protein [Cytophagaceae bacterium]